MVGFLVNSKPKRNTKLGYVVAIMSTWASVRIAAPPHVLNSVNPRMSISRDHVPPRVPLPGQNCALPFSCILTLTLTLVSRDNVAPRVPVPGQNCALPFSCILTLTLTLASRDNVAPRVPVPGQNCRLPFSCILTLTLTLVSRDHVHPRVPLPGQNCALPFSCILAWSFNSLNSAHGPSCWYIKYKLRMCRKNRGHLSWVGRIHLFQFTLT